MVVVCRNYILMLFEFVTIPTTGNASDFGDLTLSEDNKDQDVQIQLVDLYWWWINPISSKNN